MNLKRIISAVLSICLTASLANTMVGCRSNPYISDTFSTIVWSDSKLAQMLPVPESNFGLIEYDREDLLEIDIGSTTQEQYETYLNNCKEKGFTENYDRGTDYYNHPYYRAENTDGYQLELEYHKSDSNSEYRPMKDTMTVTLRAPYDKETVSEYVNKMEDSNEKLTDVSADTCSNAESESESKTEGKSESKAESYDGKATPSFKETMDSYEKFFDEYIDFIKKYSDNPDDLSLLSEYVEYLNKYSEYISALSAIDSSTLTVADYAYYMEVYTRILKKLEEIE